MDTKDTKDTKVYFNCHMYSPVPFLSFVSFVSFVLRLLT